MRICRCNTAVKADLPLHQFMICLFSEAKRLCVEATEREWYCTGTIHPDIILLNTGNGK